MSKTVLSEVDGFTPIIDDVLKETSLITAVVFGRMWRYCQMKDGVCNASLETIAEGIGLSRSAVMEHAKILVDKEYLKDHSPNLRNHPHTYSDTGKAGLHIGVSANSGVRVVNASINEENAGVSEANAGVNVDDLKIVLKKESNKENKKEILTPEKDLPLDWLIQAGVSSEEIASLNEKERHSKEITDLYEKVMGYSPLNWSGRLDRLRRFLLTKTPDEIKTFAAWSRKEFSTFTPAKARQFPDMVIDLWPQAFPVVNKRSVEDRVNAFMERR